MRPLPAAVTPAGAALAAVALLPACSGSTDPTGATVTVTASPPAATVTVTAATAPATALTAPGGQGGVPGADDRSWTAATPGNGSRTSTAPPVQPTRATRPAPATSRAAPQAPARPSTRVAPPPPATRAAPAPSAGRAAGGVRVPSLIGDSLTAAYARLTDLGVPRGRRSPHDVSGKTRTVLNPDNWKVCTQKPAPGTVATAQTVYQFGVVKFGERCP